MGRLRLSALLALLAPSLAAGAPAATTVKRVRVAVMEIRPLNVEQHLVDLLSEVALSEAFTIPGLDVIGKSDIASMIGFEKQKQVMGCADDSNCLAEIGGALGVDLILVGSLGKAGTLRRLDLKVVDIKRSKVRNRVGLNVEGSEEKLVVAVQKAVRDMLGPEGVAAQAAPPPPAALRVEPPPGSPLVPAAAPAGERGGGRTRAWVAGGLGGALLVGGAIVGLQARAALDAEKKASAAGDLKAYDDNKSKVRTYSIVADALFVGGAAGLGVGTWLWFSGRPAPAVSFGVAPAPGGAVASISGGF